MSTAMPTITFCQPAPPREGLGWDQHPSARHVFFNPAAATADGTMESNGLEFSDFGNFQIEKHKANGNGGRRLEIPDWALDNKKLSFVLAAWIENRAVMRNPGKGTTAERIRTAQARLDADRPRLISVLEGLCAKFVAEKSNTTPDAAKITRLAQKIREVDTGLRVNEDAVRFAFTIVNGYYFDGKNSSEIAVDLKMSHAHIRQTLWRLFSVAKRPATFQRPFHISIRINLLRGINGSPLHVPAKGEKVCFVCGQFFKPSHGHQKFCGRKCRRKDEAQRRRKNPELKPRAAKKYFCSTGCKDAAKFAVHSLPVLAKPGVGTYAPLPGADPYSRYADFCRVVGSEPLSREQWKMGLR